MPANLTPIYYEAEEEYRQAGTIEEKQKALRRMLAVMPKHKGTDHLRADLRTRMSKLRDQAETQSRSGSRWNPYTVRKEGAGTSCARRAGQCREVAPHGCVDRGKAARRRLPIHHAGTPAGDAPLRKCPHSAGRPPAY